MSETKKIIHSDFCECNDCRDYNNSCSKCELKVKWYHSKTTLYNKNYHKKCFDVTNFKCYKCDGKAEVLLENKPMCKLHSNSFYGYFGYPSMGNCCCDSYVDNV